MGERSVVRVRLSDAGAIKPKASGKELVCIEMRMYVDFGFVKKHERRTYIPCWCLFLLVLLFAWW